MKLEWDDSKATVNQKKYGISFLLAITIFDDPSALITSDKKHSSSTEKREWIIGKSDKGVLIVVFTQRLYGRIYRIISARKTSKKERELYEKYKRISI